MTGSLPEGAFALENVIYNENVFQADVEVFGEEITSGLFDENLIRRFEFRAGPGISETNITDVIIQGRMTERFIAENEDNAFANRVFDSTFVLTRRPLTVPSIRPTLSDVRSKTIARQRP